VEIAVAVEGARDVERAAHRDAGREPIGMPERHREGVVCAEVASGHARRRPAGSVLDERDDIGHEVALVGEISLDAIARGYAPREKALRVDRADAAHLHHARLDLVSDRLHHAAILVLVERALRRGKDDKWLARMTERQKLHVAAKGLSEPA